MEHAGTKIRPGALNGTSHHLVYAPLMQPQSILCMTSHWVALCMLLMSTDAKPDKNLINA
jgi:hypothetical protein